MWLPCFLIALTFLVHEDSAFADDASNEAQVKSSSEEASDVTSPSFQARFQRAIQDMKERLRPELTADDSWEAEGYHQLFNLSLDTFEESPEIARIHIDSLTPAEFVDRYEKAYKPLILLGAMDNWTATENWSIEQLVKSYGNAWMKVGTDREDRVIRIKLKYFAEYVRTTKDDNPAYIFEPDFGDMPRSKQLLQDYHVPPLFQEDHLQYAGIDRPPYRWFLIGSARSGTIIHIDPRGTSAWNALIHGHKRWILFPNDTPKDLIIPPYEEIGRYITNAISWFHWVYPRTQSPSWPSRFKPIEILQRPGEVLFVPTGWWHAVLNLDTTVAVTQNFCSHTNFPVVWHKLATAAPEEARKWIQKLRVRYPELGEIADRADLTAASSFYSESEEEMRENSREIEQSIQHISSPQSLTSSGQYCYRNATLLIFGIDPVCAVGGNQCGSGRGDFCTAE